MGVNLDSNSGTQGLPDKNKPSANKKADIQTFPNDEEFGVLKNELGGLVLKNVRALMFEAMYFDKTKNLNGERIFKMDITNQKTNTKDPCDFYADQFISVVPSDLRAILKSLTKTEAAAHQTFVKICIDLLRTPKFKTEKGAIKKAENITKLKNSSVIQTVAYSVLQENVWDIATRIHLCNDEYLKEWT